MPPQRGPEYYDIAYSTTVTVKEHKSKFQLYLTIDTQELAHMSELWGVQSKDFVENRPR